MSTLTPRCPGRRVARGGALVALVLALVVANLAFLAWTAGWLGTPPAEADRDGARLGRQVRPEAVRVLTPAEAAALASAAAHACLETGPLPPADAAVAEELLAAAVGTGAWSRRGPAGAAPAVASGPPGDDTASLRLRIEGADAALRERLAAIEAPVGGVPLGQRFAACAEDAPR